MLGKIGVAASPAQPGRVWALIEHAKEGGLYRSDDYGDHWEKVSGNQNLISRAWYYMHLIADPQDADTVYVNNLEHVEEQPTAARPSIEIPTPHGDNHDLWIDPRDNRRMIQGNDGGANVSFNGGYSWSTIYNQPTAQFYHVAADNRDPYYRLRHAAGQLQHRRAQPHQSPAPSPGATATSPAPARAATSPSAPTIPTSSTSARSAARPAAATPCSATTAQADQIRLVTVWPEPMRGYGAGEHKYRFAWTYPIVFSPHDPNTLYIAGNQVFGATTRARAGRRSAPI